MSARSARRPLPALIFLVALAVLASIVWIRVAQRDSDARAGATPTCTSRPTAQLPANQSVTVTVLNGSGKEGLAKATLDAFVAAGFVAGNFDNAPDAVDGVGTITSGPNGTAAAKLVSFYDPGAQVTTDQRTDSSVDVTLGAAFTALAAPPAVAADLAKAKLTQAAPPTPAPAGPSPGASPSATAGAPVTASPSPSCTSASP